jgi:hypothetical protein
MSDTKATVYFTPPGMPYDSFYIAYSRKSDAWEYGTELKQQYSGGVIKKDITLLNPNTPYYFAIRAGNGCATGGWGNTMTATTTSSPGKQKSFYKNVFTALKQNIIQKAFPVKESSSEDSSAILHAEPIATLTPMPTKVSEVQREKLLPPKNKFCILWWCW